MSDQNETVQPEETKPAGAEPSGRPGDREKRLAKSQDPNWAKVTHYLPVKLLGKLTVQTVLRRGFDQSDIIAEALEEKLSSICFYDQKNSDRKNNGQKNSGQKKTDETLTVEGDRQESAAA